MTQAWIAPEFLEWSELITGGSGGTRTDHLKHYDLLERASKALGSESDEYDLASAIFHFKRVIEFREKMLIDHINIGSLPFAKGRKNHDLLVELDVIRPLMNKKLTDIRNAVTHSEKTTIPDIETCMELGEFVWYFLRSTDRLVDSDEITYELDKNSEKIELILKPADG